MSGEDNRQASEILVPSTDPEKKDDDKPKANGELKKGKDEKEQPDIVCSRLAFQMNDADSIERGGSAIESRVGDAR